MDMKIDPTAASLTIGDEYAKDNKIEFKIQLKNELTENEAVWLKLQLPLGEDGVLLAWEDANNIDPPPNVGDRTSDSMVWSLGDYDNGVQVNGSTEITIPVSISNILCKASANLSKLTITATPAKSPVTSLELTITKAKPTPSQHGDKNPILYFIAKPTFLIGQGSVVLTWDLVDTTKTVGLSFEGDPLKEPKSGMTVKPEESGDYVLNIVDTNYQLQQHVEVLSAADWHTPDLRLDAPGVSAFPVVIFDSGNRLGDAIYAIFVLVSEGPNNTVLRNPVLYVSTNGITGWQVVNNGTPPLGMESSPGVRLGNRLWLIGGSSVDWGQKSKRICYYDLGLKNGWKEAKVTFSGDFEERMGHACVIVDDKTIWIVGGSGRYKSLNDVWKLTINDKTDPTIDARQLEAAGSGPGRWAPRCMFSAVKYGDEIWVCGGVDSPQGTPLSDIYYRKLQDTKWQLRPGVKNPVEHAIGTGVACCGSTPNEKLFVVITTTELEALVNQLGEVTTTENPWVPISKTPDTPTDFTDSNHSITAVGFQNRLYLRYLHRNMLTGNEMYELTRNEEYTPPPLFVYLRSKW